MNNIMVSSEDNKKHTVFKSQEELINAIFNNELDFTPVIKDKQFSETIFEKSQDSNNEDERQLPEISAKFENCEFNNVEFNANINISLSNCTVNNMSCYGEENSIQVKDSTLNGLDAEFSSISISGENSNFKKLGLAECDANFNTKNCNFNENNIHKTHLSGNIENGTFDISGRTYLGQNKNLTMKNVDFGSEKVNEDYFYDEDYHDCLELINCKNSKEILNKKKYEELIIGATKTTEAQKGIGR